MIKIGSARISENGTTQGKNGDQTKREVSTQDFYIHNKGWYVLRAIKPITRRKLAKAMLNACNNDNIGYSQPYRNNLYNDVKNHYYNPKKAKKLTACDCSSLVRVCLLYAGVWVGDFTTDTERQTIINTGMFTCQEYKKDMRLCKGDILVTKTKGHTAIITEV